MSTSPVQSPSHAHVPPTFHFEEDDDIERPYSAPAPAQAATAPGQTDAVLTTAVEHPVIERVVGNAASLNDAVAAKEGITPPRRRLSIEVDNEGPSPEKPLTITTPRADGPPEITTFDAAVPGARELSPPTTESSTSSRRYCGCLEGWLPSCIIDFFEWICCCFCCYNADETNPLSPDFTPLTRLPATRFRSTDETEIRILTQIEFAIRERAGNLTQHPPSDRCKIIALLDLYKEGSSVPVSNHYQDFYSVNSSVADDLSFRFMPKGEGAKLRNFEFAFITIDSKENAQIHVFTYNEKSDRPHHAPVINCASTNLEELQQDHPVLQQFKEADFNSKTLRSPVARTPSPSTLEVIGRMPSI